MMTATFKWMAMGAVLGFSVAMGVSCGPAKCTPSNCAFGCCDAKEVCQMGSSDSQCGISGVDCSACQLGTQCRLGICISGNTGGGNGGGNGGGGATGGGTGGGVTGGGTGGGVTGGGTGGGVTGGGTGGGVTGGGTGGGVTGGGTGGGVTGGGSGSCAALGSAYNTLMAGRATCPGPVFTLNAAPNLASSCSSGCNSTDQVAIQSFVACISGAACTSGNEANATGQFQACGSDGLGGLSTPCQSVFGPLVTAPTGGGTGGGGGAPVGGGTGGGAPVGGGGGTTTCTTLTNAWTRPEAGYSNTANFELTSGSAYANTSDPSDVINMEVIWAISGTSTGVMTGTRDLAFEGTYNFCKFCATLGRSCTAGANCTGGVYFARSGTMTVNSASRATTGTFSASLSNNVRFDEWNLSTDAPVAGGRCFIVPSGSIIASF